MAFVPVAETAQITVTHLCEAQRLVNVFHARRAGGWTTVQMGALLGEVMTWVGTDLYDLLPQGIALVSVHGRDLSTSGGLVVEQQPTTAVVGAIITQNLPLNVAFCVQARTGFAGRHARGRSYVPAVPATVQAQSTVTQAWADGIAASYNRLRTTLAPMGFPLQVVSKSSGGVDRAFGLTTLITSFGYSNLVLDSQRRRLPGRGN
jgi:hypothetical protein